MPTVSGCSVCAHVEDTSGRAGRSGRSSGSPLSASSWRTWKNDPDCGEHPADARCREEPEQHGGEAAEAGPHDDDRAAHGIPLAEPVEPRVGDRPEVPR